jgi:hypothetical protein
MGTGNLSQRAEAVQEPARVTPCRGAVSEHGAEQLDVVACLRPKPLEAVAGALLAAATVDRERDWRGGHRSAGYE